MWRIWCEVTGGVTGSRAAWLKQADGQVLEWPDEADAEAEAIRLREGRPNKPGAAQFRYTAKEV